MSLSNSTASYNESGVFLQTHVYEEFRKRNWSVTMEYPVVVAPFRKNPEDLVYYRGGEEKPSPDTFVRAIKDSQNSFELSERSIDIVASRSIDDNRRLKFCIECKKLNPKYTEWCFFQQQDLINKMHVITKTREGEGIATLMHAPITTGYGNEIFLSINRKYNDLPFIPKIQADFGIALTNEKIRKDYYNTEKTVVDTACRQIIEGTYGLTLEVLIHQILSRDANEFGNTDIFIPIIVTNTKLKYCKFDPSKINPYTGHLDKEPIYDDIDAVIYEYNSPKTVQYPEPLFGNLDVEIRKATSKWYVFVFSPKGLVDFLNQIESLWGEVK